MRTALVTTTLLAIASTPLLAMDSHIVGPRAQGMGGAGTAAVDDSTASFWNPAMYGFFSRTGEEDAKLDADPNYVGRKDWGIGLVDAGVQVEVRGNLADYVQQLAGTDLNKLSSLGGPNSSPDDLKAAAATATLLQKFNAKSDNVLVLANAGLLNTRILHVGIGLRQYAEGIISVADLDKQNVGYGANSDAVLAGINDPSATPSGWTSGYTPSLITGSSADAIAQVFGAANYALANQSIKDAISKLDYAAGQAGLGASDIAAITAAGGILNLALSGSGDINNNQTAVFTGGYTLAEVPLSIGYAFNDYISVGGNLKLMVGRVAGAKVRLLSGTDKIAELMKNAFDTAEQTVTGGIDLGFAARCSWAQVGLTARNINRPVLKGGSFQDADGQPFTVADVDIDPQVALGVALYPWETFCLTADLDLTENSTTISTTSGRTPVAGIDQTLKVEFASQRASLGAEWNVLHFLALRGGMSKDLAESATGAMLHGGLGFNLWAIRFDVAGAISTEKATVDGEDIPRAANVSAGLTIDF